MAEEAELAGYLTAEWLKHELGLDVPMHIQYGRWLRVVPNEEGIYLGAVQGHLGKSLWTERPVLEDLMRRLPVSAELGGIATIVGLIIALPIGIYSAIRQDTWGDYGGRTIAILAISSLLSSILLITRACIP